MPTKPERADEPLRWLRANNHLLGVLTGQDTRALLAIAACWRLYFGGDENGQLAALLAVRFLLRGMQSKAWHLAKALIPWVGDWSDEGPVWSRLVDGDTGIHQEWLDVRGAS
jgi:hypothetical protein